MKLLKLVLEYKESTVRELVDKFKNETDKDEDTIRKYINYFDKIKDNAPEKDIFKYSFEQLFDYVNMKTDKVEIDIENDAIPVEYDKEIFNKNGLEVYLSQSHKACVKYSDGYSFCIGYPKDDSHFHKHSKDKTIYFIFDRKRDKTDINHVNVLMLLKDKTFEVTDALNKSFNGVKMSFEEIVERYPELKGQQHLFKYVEKPSMEKTYYPDLLRYFKSYHETKKYIAIHSLTANQFKNLPDKLKDDFINRVEPIMFSLLNEKQLKRYLFLLLRNKKDMFLIDKFDNGFNSIQLSEDRSSYYDDDDELMGFSNLFQVDKYDDRGQIIFNDNLSIVIFAKKYIWINDYLLLNDNNKCFVLGSDGISPIIENENFIKSLTNVNTNKILYYLPQNERLPFINKVIELNKNFIKNLTVYDIDIILNNLDKNEASPFIKKVIGLNKDFINTITGNNIGKILYYLDENERSPFINKIIESNKDFINTITGDNINISLKYIPKNERSSFINKVIELNKDFINTLTSNNIDKILNNLDGNEKSKLLNTLTKKDDFNKNIDIKILILILKYSNRPISLFKRLPKEKRLLIKVLPEFYDIENLLYDSANQDSVTKLLKHYNMI